MAFKTLKNYLSGELIPRFA